MDLCDLEALLWLHTHGSLQGAARAQGVSRGTLRRRLARLEGALGKPAVRVGPDGVELTAAGRTLVERGPALLEAGERLVEQARHAAGAGELLRLMGPTGLPPRATAVALAAVQATLPDVRLDLALADDPEPLDSEGFDAVLHWGRPPVGARGYTRVLMRFAMCVQGSTAYLDAHGRPTTLEALAGHRLLTLRGSAGDWPLRAGGTVPVQAQARCSDFYVLGCMAGADMGLALLPRSGPFVDPTIDALEPVLQDVIGAERELRIYVPVPTEPGSAAQALVAAVERIAGQLPTTDD